MADFEAKSRPKREMSCDRQKILVGRLCFNLRDIPTPLLQSRASPGNGAAVLKKRAYLSNELFRAPLRVVTCHRAPVESFRARRPAHRFSLSLSSRL